MREKLIALHSVLCRSIYAEYDEAQRAPVIDLLKTAENLIANGVVISNSETTTKWIPVTERLPEYETEVLTYRKSGISVETRWRTYWDYDEFSDSPVTHWMPLPQPPKGE